MVVIMTTQFITTRNEYHRLEWPDSRHYITTTVLGDLADRVRKAAGEEDPSAEVQIVEKGSEGGYSEYTVEWLWTFEIHVAGQRVFDTDAYGRSDLTDGEERYTYNGLARMFEWLKESGA